MAFQIAYIFEGIDRFSKVAAKIEKSMDKIEGKVKGVRGNLQKLEDRGKRNLQKLQKLTVDTEHKFGKLNTRIKKGNRAMQAMTALAGNLKFRLASLAVTATMTGFGLNKIIDKGKQTETAFVNLSALTGITGKDLEFLRQKAHEFARVFGIESKDIFVAFKRVAGLKPELIGNVKALAELTKWTLILDAPIGQLEKTSRALTVALNIYGKSADNAAEFSNILAAGARFGSAEVNEMALSFLKAGTVAETVSSISFLDLMTMIEAVAQKGLLAQVSGTGLRTVMIRLQKAGFDFKKLGVAGVFEKIKQQLDATTDSTKKAQLAYQLFGMRQQAVGLALTNNVPLLKKLKKEMQGTNLAVDTANKSLITYEKQSKAIADFFEKKFVEIFGAAKPHLLDLKRQLVIFFEILDKATPGGFKGTISFLIWGLARVVQLLNVATLTMGIMAAPIRAAFGDIGALKAIPELLKRIKEIETTPIKLETLLKPAELKGGVGGTPTSTNGRVSVDLNLKGNTDALASLEATTEGDVDLNTGKNLAFIG
jgi:TP901 family phage tail tape measure protein